MTLPPGLSVVASRHFMRRAQTVILPAVCTTPNWLRTDRRVLLARPHIGRDCPAFLTRRDVPDSNQRVGAARGQKFPLGEKGNAYTDPVEGSICWVGGKFYKSDNFPRFIQLVGHMVADADVPQQSSVDRRKDARFPARHAERDG